MSLQTGDSIDGKYRIVRLLGDGGMGGVYEGENTRIHRRVAIKVLHAAVAAKSDVSSGSSARRRPPVASAASTSSRSSTSASCPTATRYMVMEYLEGETLGDRIKRTDA